MTHFPAARRGRSRLPAAQPRALAVALIVAIAISLACVPRSNHAQTSATASAIGSAAVSVFAQTTTPAPAPSAAAAPIASADKPHVALVTTGGTIANRPGGRLSAEELLASVPQVAAYAQVDAEEFSNLASGELTLDQWIKLSRRLNEIVHGTATTPAPAGVVVTSGTDTLEELAYFLHLTVRTDRPVVIVGAMRRPGVAGYEGQANLLDAVRVAADPQSRGKGALVVLNDEIWSAREVTKTDAQRLNTFQTRGYGVLGVVDADRVVYYRDLVKRHSARSEFDITSVTMLPRVDVLMTYQGAPGDLIRAAVDQGARGIVIASAAGGTSGTQADGIRYAREKQVIVVRSTRTGAGRIAAPRLAAPSNGGGTNGGGMFGSTLAAEDLSPIKARILLMLALTKTSTPEDIQRMFLEY